MAWSIVTIDGLPVRSSSGLLISPDYALKASTVCDVLIVVSGYGFRQQADARTRRTINRCARAIPRLIGVDTGAWLLAAAGLLNERQATIHWQVESQFREQFPKVQLQAERFVRSGRIWTAGGASTVLELMGQLIEERFGAAMAFNVSSLFLHDGARQFGDAVGPGHFNGSETRELHTAINRMVETVETPVSLEQIARYSGISLRTMHRLFRNRLDMSPGRYYQSLRLAHARDLAESTDLSLQQMASRTGFATPSTLCRAYKSHFGRSIRQQRVQAMPAG